MNRNIEILTRCERCKSVFGLNHQDTSRSKHANAIIVADMDKEGLHYERSVSMLCPECLNRVKKFIHFEDDLNQSDD